jgi:hypothetical protein
MQYYTPDDGQKTCLKHVEFYSKNRFEKLVHLVGFIIGRLFHPDLLHEKPHSGAVIKQRAEGRKRSKFEGVADR